MLARLRKEFAPPRFDDEDANNAATILNALLLLLMASLPVAGIITAIIASDTALALVINVAITISLIPIYLLLRRGFVRLVGLLLVGALWSMLTGAIAVTGGPASPALGAYLVLILIASLLLGTVGALGTAGVTIAAIWAIYGVAAADRLPDAITDNTDLNIAVVYTLYVGLAAIFLYIATRTLARAYQSVRYTLDDLQQTSVSKNYVDNILLSMSNMLFTLNRRGFIETVNSATIMSLGYQERELIGKPLNELLADDPESLTVEKLIESRTIRNADQQLRAKDGRIVPVSFSSSVMYHQQSGYMLGIVCVAQDVTERKEAEFALHRRADQLAILHYINTQVGGTLDMRQVMNVALNSTVNLSGASAGFILLTGEEKTSQAIDTFGGYSDMNEFQVQGVVRRVLNSEAPEMVVDVRQDPDYVVDIPDTVSQIVLPLVSQDRFLGVIDLESADPDIFTPENFEVLKISAGRIAAALDNARLYLMSQTQVTELQELYEKVSGLESLKTEMIRVAAHDLRNPIGIIRGYLELLRLDALPRMTPQEGDYFESIVKMIDRMEGIIDDILSLERIEQMASQPFAESVDLRDLTQKAYESQQSEAERKRQSFTLTLPDDASASLAVPGDSAQLFEAISNLVVNAIKYTPEAGDITVNLSCIEDRAKFAVHDTGYGIPVDQQDRLFQPFYRAKSEATKDIDGTGLGLHLVKNIIERHGGHMIFHSVYGEGSEFGFEINLKKTN
jgi:PAS domain S-box-containing protein